MPALNTPGPQLNGILETCLYVLDPDRSATFYESLLGFAEVDRSDRLIALRVADRQLLLLFRRGASADQSFAPHDGTGELHLAFAIPAADLGAWEARLRDARVAVEQKRVWPRGGVSIYFRDPDRHLIELATPGVWTVY
jgi:catechol 2,3-dioxygenase-like lactoylglutathione lyase family enzyme